MECTIENKKQVAVEKFPCFNNSIHDMDGEIWLPVNRYENLYEVSVFGRIKGVDRIVKHSKGGGKIMRSKILLQHIDKKGYCQVQLNKNGVGKTLPVHRIVALSFIPNPYNKSDVNHRFGIKKDNRFHQLEWLTGKEHAEHTFFLQGRGETHSCFGKLGVLNKRSKVVLQYSLFGKLINEFHGCREACRKTGVNYASIGFCCNGRYKSAGGFIWKFKNK